MHEDHGPAQPAAGADVEVRLGGESVDVLPGLDELGRSAVDAVRRVIRLVLEGDVHRRYVIGDGVLLGLGEPGADLRVLVPRRDRGIGDPAAMGHIQAGQHRGALRHHLLDVRRGELLANEVVDPDDRELAAKLALLGDQRVGAAEQRAAGHARGTGLHGRQGPRAGLDGREDERK